VTPGAALGAARLEPVPTAIQQQAGGAAAPGVAPSAAAAPLLRRIVVLPFRQLRRRFGQLV